MQRSRSASNGMIAVHKLRKDYLLEEVAVHAVSGVTFLIKQGEFVSIMGPSGSGKSTLLQILGFLDRPTGGTYTFLGKNMSDLSDKELAYIRNHEMGFVFQSFNLLSRATVYENVEMPLLYSQDVATHDRKKKIEDAVEAVGISEKLYMEVAKLSGGQKQRVAIARALINNPEVIFADEPTGNLDSKSGAQVMDILEGLHKQGRTIILVTHETYTAEFADRLIHIKDGEIESDKAIVSKRHNSKESFLK